ncbi:MAG: hypothetical protein MZV70_42140 [Desulfobacterales bacterium]|nr:hypothetical protein [Desulfobacterales bacterium]
MSDLVRQIDLPVKVGFARLSSYGNSDSPQGDVKILEDVREPIDRKHVIIVDDIMDTGHSLYAFKKHLEDQGPASVKICTMIDKTCRRDTSLSPDFYGFRIADGFVVGYGLDFAENFRALPDICVTRSQQREGPLVIIVTCPNCHSKYRFSAEGPARSVVKMRCSICRPRLSLHHRARGFPGGRIQFPPEFQPEHRQSRPLRKGTRRGGNRPGDHGNS